MNVDDVATTSHCEPYTAGRSNLQDVLPEEWFDEVTSLKSARPALTLALTNVLDALASRVPPILEADITTPSQLRNAVVLGALEIVYNMAIQHEGSPNVERARNFGKMYRAALSALQPTVADGRRMPASITFRVHRG